MTKTRSTNDVFEQEFLPIRAKLLEVAASLDRLGRASGTLEAEAKRRQLQAAIQVLLHPGDDRAEQIQLIFSRAFEEDWKKKFGMTNDE